MSLHNNHPTFSYISASGISVVYNDKMYTVSDFNTNKQFIYWNIETPSVFRASNERPSTYEGQFLVLVNENGTAIEIPNEKVQVYYDGNSVQSIRDRIFGLYETDKEHGDRFVAVEQDIDGIGVTVGEMKEEDHRLNEYISSVDIKADGIDLSVKDVTKEFNTTETRDELNSCIIKVNSNLGIFKGEFISYSKDDSISSDEKTQIEVQIEILEDSKSKLDVTINKVIDIATDKDMNNEKNILQSAKSALTSSHNNLITVVRNVVSDNIITPSDRTLVINAFAQYNLKVNELKNACDSIVILGMGGSITEELGNISVRSDGIDLEVEKKVNGDSIISAINISPESIKIKSTKLEIDGLVTFSNLTDGTTTISGSNIKTGTIDGIRIRSFSGNRGVELYNGYTDFYNGSTNIGWLGYDNTGAGSSSEARDRLWLTTRNGYALKLQSNGNMSLEANGTIYLTSNTSISSLSSSNISSTYIYGSTLESSRATIDTIIPRALGNGGTTLMHNSLDGNGKNLGYSGSRFNQVSAYAGYFDNMLGVAYDLPAISRMSNLNTQDILEDVIIEDTTLVKSARIDNQLNRLVININKLKENPNGYLFVSEDDLGNKFVNESSLLALALQEIKNLKELIKQ